MSIPDLAQHPDDAVAVVHDAAKRYRRGRERANLRAALPGVHGRRTTAEHDLVAVDGVSLVLRRGEALGIIGPNGSGKSTLLKLIAGVTLPSAGTVCTRGRIASLIELGVGFHPDLTGEENIADTAAVLGMSREELQARRDAIVAFSGIGEEAMRAPVKRFSSGMLARLGFSIAAHVDAELLIVDEVLSVGDAEFQRRSFERIREMKDAGAAIAFVSHDLWVVGQICDRAVALDAGKVVDEGPPREVADRYAGAGVSEGGVWGRAPVQVDELALDPPAIETGGGFGVLARVTVHEPTPHAHVHVRIEGADGVMVSESEVVEASAVGATTGRWRVDGEVFSFPFSAGLYRVELSVVEGDDPTAVLSRATAGLEVGGPVASRASVRLHDHWEAEPLEP